MGKRDRIEVAAFVAGALLFGLFACVSVPLDPAPDGTPRSALVPGISGDAAADLAGSGLLDFLPAPLRAVAQAAMLYVGVRTGQSALTKSGRANWATIVDREASWPGTFAAVSANTLGTSSPLEAVERRADALATGGAA